MPSQLPYLPLGMLPSGTIDSVNRMGLLSRGFANPMRYVGGQGDDGKPLPNVGGATQEMNTFDKEGNFMQGPSKWSASFDPEGRFDRIGNAKDANGNVIMAPPAGNSNPGMGRIGSNLYPGMGNLDSFYQFQHAGPANTSSAPNIVKQHPAGFDDPFSPSNINSHVEPEWTEGPFTPAPDIFPLESSQRRRRAFNSGDFQNYINSLFLGNLS